MLRRPGFIVFCCLGAFVLAGASPRLLAQGMFEGVKSRIYAGLAFSYYNIIGNSFDGTYGFSGPGDYLPVPKMEAAKGFGVVLGFRGENVGIELSYYYHRHNGTLEDPTPEFSGTRAEKVSDHNLNIDFKGRIWPGGRLEGYYQAGLAVVFISVNKALFGIENDEWKAMGDVTYQAAGLNIGLGLDFWLIRELGLTAGVFYRPLFFTTLKESPFGSSAEGGTFDVDVSGMKGHGLGVIIGILVNLK